MATRGWRKQVLAMPLDTVEQRLSVVGLRLGYKLLWMISFAAGSLGALLLFAWPPLLKTILSALFLIIIVALLWGALARFLLSPQAAGCACSRSPTHSARHWTRWSAVLLSWFFGGWVAMQVLHDFDMDQPVRLPIAYALGLVLFVLAMVALWRRPALYHAEEGQRERARNITIAAVHAVRGAVAALGVRREPRPSGWSRWRSPCPPRSAWSTARWTMF